MNTVFTKSARWIPVMCLAIASTMTMGCAGLTNKSNETKTANWFPKMPWSNSDQDEPYPNPVKIALAWTPDTLVQPGKTPTRGFGGRVYFFDEKTRAVPVEGTLTIHGFEETGTPENAKIQPFEFTPEQLTQRFSRTDVGASYSIWIPWDAVGGEQKRISLVATFKTVDGKLVQGIPATIELPGRVPDSRIDTQLARRSPRFQKHQRVASSTHTPKSGLVTTTIPGRTLPGHGVQPGARSLQLPAAADEIKDMIADGKRVTPFVDISGQSSAPTVLPASAEMESSGQGNFQRRR